MKKFNDKSKNWKREKKSKHKFTPDKNNFIGQSDKDFKNASTLFIIKRNRSTD